MVYRAALILCLVGCQKYQIVIDTRPNIACDQEIVKEDKWVCYYNTVYNEKITICSQESDDLKNWKFRRVEIEPIDEGNETCTYEPHSDRLYFVEWINKNYSIWYAEREGVWQRKKEVVRGVEPWEILHGQSFVGDPAVLWDGKYRMWYQAGSELSPDPVIGYTESEDGINWGPHQKTDLKLYHIDVIKRGERYYFVGWARDGIYYTSSAKPTSGFAPFKPLLLEKDSFKPHLDQHGLNCHSTGLFSANIVETDKTYLFFNATVSTVNACEDKSQNKGLIGKMEIRLE